MRKALLLCMLCLATSIVFAQEQQQQPPQLQVGDTVTVNKDATHYLTGERISKWVYRVTHRIRQIGTKQWKDGILIRGINSWLAPTDVTRVGEERPAVVEQPKEAAPVVAEQPQEEASSALPSTTMWPTSSKHNCFSWSQPTQNVTSRFT